MITPTNRIYQCGIYRRIKFANVAILLFAFVVGCTSSDQGTLSGQVTLDGEPIEVGSIVLIPNDPRSGKGTGGRIANGEYLLEGRSAPLVGEYSVQIRASRKSGHIVRPAFAGPDTPLVEGTEEAVAARYNEKTTLKIKVEPGHNEKNWDVESRE